jgi:hypothetical protein
LGLAADSFDPQAWKTHVPGKSNSRRPEDTGRQWDGSGLLADLFLRCGLTYNEFFGPSLDLGRTRFLSPNYRRKQAHWY